MFLGLTSENSASDGFPDHRLRHNSSAIWGHVLPSAIIWKIRASTAISSAVEKSSSSSHSPVRGICPPVSGQWLSKARSQEAASHPLLRSSADGRAFDSHRPSTCVPPLLVMPDPIGHRSFLSFRKHRCLAPSSLRYATTSYSNAYKMVTGRSPEKTGHLPGLVL